MQNVYLAVFERGEPVFDIAGTFLNNPLKETDRIKVSPEMISRLVSYAEKELDGHGFPTSGDAHVELTIDPGDKLSDGVFHVGFKNEKGGTIGVQGILIKNAWPLLDHGPFITTD
jgi:hypothetical protein